MNDDRGTHGEDTTGAGQHARRERAPEQYFGVGSHAGGAGNADGQVPYVPPDVTAGNGQYRPPGTDEGPGPGVGYGAGGGPGGFGTSPATGVTGQPAGPAAAAPPGSHSGRDDATQPVDLGSSRHARGARKPEPDGQATPARHRKGRSWWIELPILLFFALVLALLIKTFVVQAFFIPSSSMENTLEIGDKVLVNKLVYDFRPIHRGDVVVFNGDGSWNIVAAQSKPPLVRLWDSISGLFGTAPGVHDYIKRVIGVPGDHIACCTDGRVTVNGVPLSEKSYLYPGNSPSDSPFSIVVPPGRLWVMGDHRSVSYDSRGHMHFPGGGTIPEDHVVGRAFVIIAPVSRWRILPIPPTFQQPKLAAAGGAAGAAAGGATGITPAGAPAAAASVSALAGEPGGPLALGLVAAFPLTWAQRRVQRRVGALARRRFGTGGSGAGPPGRGHG